MANTDSTRTPSTVEWCGCVLGMVMPLYDIDETGAAICQHCRERIESYAASIASEREA